MTNRLTDGAAALKHDDESQLYSQPGSRQGSVKDGDTVEAISASEADTPWMLPQLERFSGAQREGTARGMDWSKVDEAMSGACVPFSEGAAGAPSHSVPRGASAGGRGAAAGPVFPGAVLLVGRGGEIVYHKAFGCRALTPEMAPMDEQIVFDVASLTKPVVTTTLLMQLVDRGLLEVDRRISRVIQTVSTHGKDKITIRNLLNHSSGYAAYVPFYKQIAQAHFGSRTGIMASRGAVDAIYNEIFRMKLENPPGKVARYSDVGFILLGAVLETICGGMSVEKLAIREIFRPLGLSSSGFINLSALRSRGLTPDHSRIAATADCPWRKRVIWGEVHDDNAWVMGGVAAHAGLFSTATDLHQYAVEMIDCWSGRGSLVSQETVRQFWTRDDTVPGSTWALGWDTPSKKSSAGKYFPARSVGHLGYTGCSMWIDPQRELDVILLTNRVHPSTENNQIREFRPLIHDLVMETLGLT
jgi:CubicO group peptidase (beta-lactamase class C family)